MQDVRGYSFRRISRRISMSLDSDVIVDRRRIRRKLTFWRVTAALVAIAAIAIVGVVVTPGGLWRLYHRDRRRPYRRPTELAGRFDRCLVSISEFHRAVEDRRRPGRGSEVFAAQSSTQRLRADQSGGPRRARCAREGLLCVV